jgi:hypothetical protein
MYHAQMTPGSSGAESPGGADNLPEQFEPDSIFPALVRTSHWTCYRFAVPLRNLRRK